MKLRIGDKVRLLNEVGEGVVSRIKDKITVFVEMKDGFEIPYPVKELVPIHSELIIDNQNDNLELDEDKQIAETLYFVLEPDHELPALVSEYKIYLFNSTSYHLLYSYSVKDNDYYQSLKQGEIGPFQKVLIKPVKALFFEEYGFHKVECLFFKNTYFKTQSPVSEIIQINSKSLSVSKTIEHEQFKNPVFAYILKDEFFRIEKVEADLNSIDIEKLRSIKEFKNKNKISKSNRDYLKTLEKEVDLHIDELVEDIKGLSNFEMLTIQLERFSKELDKAIENRMKKIIFIHGVGNGRLKQEIIKVLKATHGISYHDASYKEYGYGATQINIL